jgi:hypothetical protein
MKECKNYIPDNFGDVDKIFDLDDTADARALGIDQLNNEVRADIYACNKRKEYLVQECKSNNSIRHGIEQLEKTATAIIRSSFQIHRAIIIAESFGNESMFFKRRKGSSNLFYKRGKHENPVTLPNRVQVELYLKSEIKQSRRK